MNKIFIGIVTIIAVGGVIWIARPTSQSENTASLAPSSNRTLSAQELSFDFGTISMAAGNVSHAFTIKNTGADSVAIEKMYTSCMCTTALLTLGGKQFGPYGMPGHAYVPKINKSLNPGEEATVEVVFDPTAHGPAGVGAIQRVVTIENNAGEPLELQFSALVTP